MIVHFLERIRAKNPADDVSRYRFAAGVGVAARQGHRGNVILPRAVMLRRRPLAERPSHLSPGRFQEMRRRLVPETA